MMSLNAGEELILMSVWRADVVAVTPTAVMEWASGGQPGKCHCQYMMK